MADADGIVGWGVEADGSVQSWPLSLSTERGEQPSRAARFNARHVPLSHTASRFQSLESNTNRMCGPAAKAHSSVVFFRRRTSTSNAASPPEMFFIRVSDSDPTDRHRIVDGGGRISSSYKRIKNRSPQPDPIPCGYPPPILQFPTIIRRGRFQINQWPASPSSAESSTGEDEECSLNERHTKRINCSEGEKGAAAPVAAGDEGDVPPPKKMWRLPREEVHWILAQSNEPACAWFRDLKRANPSLVPSPEEEKDPSTVLLYTCARISYQEEEKFAKFQAWVRCEYASKGFVEVDYDYFGRRAEVIRRSNEVRDEVLKDYDLSSDDEDDYAGKLIKRTGRDGSDDACGLSRHHRTRFGCAFLKRGVSLDSRACASARTPTPSNARLQAVELSLQHPSAFPASRPHIDEERGQHLSAQRPPITIPQRIGVSDSDSTDRHRIVGGGGQYLLLAIKGLHQCPVLPFPTIIRRGEKSSDQPMAGGECQQMVFPVKRKAESSTGEDEDFSLNERATKRIDCSEGAKGAAAPVAAGDEGEVAPPKKMWRLPREEVHWILAQSNEPACAEFRDLKRANPSLVPSPEEKDPSTVLLYTCARISYEEEEKFAKFQAWVRCEYASKGFVEVDYDYFGRRAEVIRRSNEVRDEVFKDYDLSSDDEDDYAGKLIKRTARKRGMAATMLVAWHNITAPESLS
ncbi:hypothetical protein HU200_043594 [Digitaria exilis]|uniref:Uncharacterized protein n=1 Tax=Digitaria exilis TaxID=1010633 RepID=A0A835BB03_9POAL|nr:hypothetical protein HU200_043594 [Digitaria exilis]